MQQTIVINNDKDVNSNFISFFKKHRIEIPLIQRDYVQGSNMQSKKRDEFLDSLFDALIDDNKPCELDFIYGTDNNGVFLPLDGQQRLTTLFLLHWFLINKCRLEDLEEYDKITESLSWNLCDFRYKTRRSSTVFCEKLMSYKPEKWSDSISKDINQQSWFSEDWNLDPTVVAMMEMLDAINNKYNSCENANAALMLSRIISSNIINFDKLDMGKYKLNDSLYVKMNARGKQLTEFENWKARFIKFLEEIYKNDNYEFAEDNRIDFKCIKDYFTHSIEHEWTDLFWTYAVSDYKLRKNEYDNLPEEERYKKSEVTNPLIDDYFLNFYHYIFCMRYFLLQKDEDNEDNENSSFDSEKSRMDLFSQKDNISFLYQSLDLFVHIKENMSLEDFFNNLFYLEGQKTDGRVRLFSSKTTNLFESCITNKASVDEQVLLYCLIVYCIKNQCYTITNGLKLYIRVCRNLLESINQRLTKDMQIHSNVRLSHLARYSSTINDLCSTDNIKDKDSIASGMGDTENIINMLKYYPDSDIYCLEDSGYTQGSLYAFDLETNHSDILKAFIAFKNTSDLNRVRLLVAYGYPGTDFGLCAHGVRRFFGYYDRWNVIFRYKPDAPVLKAAFSSFVSDYKQTPDIKALILSRANNNIERDSFAYYFLKYDAFANSALWWTMDETDNPANVDAHHFFAIQSEHDVITLPRFSSNPLLGYHTEPYACTVAQYFRNKYPTIYEKMDYTGKDRMKAHLIFNDCNVELVCLEEGWKVLFIDKSSDLQKRHFSISKLKELSSLCDRRGRNHHIIHKDDGKDRIETAINFILKMYQ